MSFYYEAEIKKLRTFKKTMLKLKVEIGTFEFQYNEILTDVIFDTRSSESWEIIFMKVGIGKTLTIPIKLGYKFTIDTSKKYQEFISFFNIKNGKGKFSIKSFKDYFNENIPDEYKLSDNAREKIIKYNRIDTGSEGIYPISLKNWELIHAKNNKLPKDKFHRRPENLAKTKQLYPDLYEAIKDKDISVKYSTEIGGQTEQIKKLNF